MISKEKIILLINLTNSLDETFKELEKAQDSNDYLRFNILKKDLAKIQQEISQTLWKPKTT